MSYPGCSLAHVYNLFPNVSNNLLFGFCFMLNILILIHFHYLWVQFSVSQALLTQLDALLPSGPPGQPRRRIGMCYI